MTLTGAAYAIAEFSGSMSSAIIYTGWKVMIDKKLYCYFPKTNATEKAKKRLSPKLNSNWPLHAIKILGPETDDWNVALQWLPKSEYTINLDSTSPDTENSRKRQPRKRLHESLDDEVSEDFSSSAAPATKKNATESDSEIGTTGVDELDHQSVYVPRNDVANNPGPLVGNEGASSSMFERNEVSFSRGSCSCGAIGTIVEGNLEFDVRDAIGQIQDTLSRLEPIIMEMSQNMKSRRNDKKQSDLIMEDIIPVTMTTKEDLKAFDKKLQEQKEFASDAIFGFSSVGGNTMGQTVRFIMKKVATAGVWSCYSRIGKTGKEAFSHLALYKIIYRACKRIHGRNFTEKDYIRVVTEALRHFPSQKGGSRWKGVEKEKTDGLSSSEDETIQLLTLHS